MEQPSASGSITSENIGITQDKLEKLWNQGLLTTGSFQNIWWKVSALNNYKIEHGQDGIPKIVVDEIGVHQHVFESLEQFIYRRDKTASLKELEKIENPTVLCGHVFNCGESTYTCRDCALDPTCVFCVDCFNHSAHRNHRYKMSTSSGGGSCDCGDVEAWKTEAWCSNHKTANVASMNQQESDNTYEILDSLDQDIVNRIKLVFKAAIIYASDFLMHCNYHHVPGGLTPNTTRCPDLLDANLSSSPTYCTILYNDELHDYDQVTSALEGAMMCSQKTATDLMTNADRKGRTLVASGDFKTCRQVYTEIKRISMLPGNRPLKLSILHSSVVANQYFALDMLVWLEKMVKNSKAMRLIFSQFTMQDSLDCALLRLMNNTSRMWKEARSLWIRLFFNGTLLEYGTKKIFAKLLSIHYDVVLEDFLKDDQDHTFSILSLSVQVYTVPSLALYLMEQHNVLYHLIDAFFNQCLHMDNVDRLLSSNMKLKLGHHQEAKKLQRIYFVLSDICYILSVKPNEWNDDSRTRFILGFSMLVKLLGLMQGMEPFTRCLRGHVEYEQRWEYSFHLQSRMAFVLNSVQDWCGSDREVLTETYKNLLSAIGHNPLAGMIDGVLVKCAVGKYSVECLHYDVARKEISVHIPMTRLFSDIYLHLQKYGLNFNSPELQISSKPTIEQILEPVLRMQVLIAQVHANMWRRNGLGLPIQLQWYASRKCRREMLDSDIALLQTAATIMDSNDFVITMLNRFDLLKWAEEQYCQVQVPGADKLQEVIVLAEEFLRLLIVIVGERYKPGVGQVTAEECLCHEIVQQLCVKTMSHSELNRTLPKDFHLETGLDDVVDLVATLKEQTHGKREYELKPECAKEFNIFSYHYNREDRSVAEENHLKRKKLAKELECCSPPLPPPFTPAYSSVLNVLQCDVVFIIMKNVIERALMQDFKCFSELQLQETLYLIGYGLIEEERQIETAKSTSSSCTNIDLKFSTKAEEMKILPNLLEDLLKNPKTETRGQSSLITWVLHKYRQVLKPRNSSSSSDMILEETFENPVAGTSHDEDEAKQRAKLTRSELIAKQRLQTLQQMQALQENFMKNHATYLAVVDAEMQEEESVSMQLEVEGINLKSPVALGPNRTTAAPVERRFTCLLCQATEVVGAPESRHMVMTGLVQQSTVLCRKREKVKRSLEDDKSMACISKDFPCLANNLGPAPYVSSCGHKLHTECFYTYHAKSVEAESQRLLRDLPPLFDVDKGELLCPLCKNLSNVVLPVLPPMDTLMTNSEKQMVDFNLDDWLCSLKVLLDPKMEEQLKPESQRKHSSLITAQKQLGTKPELDTFSQLTETIYKAATSQGLQNYVEHHPIYLWQTCAYTIHASEWVQRESGKALLGQFTSRQEETLRSLILSAALDPAFLNSNALKNIAHDLLKIVMQPEDAETCFIEWDMFGLLVSLTFAIPSLFANGENMFLLPACETKELHTLHLVLLANIVNLMLGMAMEQSDVPMEVDTASNVEEDMDGLEALNLLKIVCEAAKIPGPTCEFTPSQLWKRLTQDCVPFLRCCAIFFRFLSGVPASPALSEPGGDTFTELCAFLGLPTTCKGLLDHQTTNEMAKRWCSHKKIKMLLNDKTVTLGPVKLNTLVPLVTDYKDQLNLVNAFRCTLTNVESHNPTMCLVCGEIVCAKSFCCQKKIKGRLLGPAMIHSYQCGAGIGLFLSIRDCEILVLYSPDQGCFLTPPYVDKYGETDQGLERGNPLYLCMKTYKDLYTQWLSHSLIQTICHKYDDSSHRHYLWHKF